MIDERKRTEARLMGATRIGGRGDNPLFPGPREHARSGGGPRNRLQSLPGGITLSLKRTHRTVAQKGRYEVRLSRPQGRLVRPCSLCCDAICLQMPRFKCAIIDCVCASTSGIIRFPSGTTTRRSTRTGRSSGPVLDGAAASEYQGLNFCGTYDPDRRRK